MKKGEKITRTASDSAPRHCVTGIEGSLPGAARPPFDPSVTDTCPQGEKAPMGGRRVTLLADSNGHQTQQFSRHLFLLVPASRVLLVTQSIAAAATTGQFH